MKIGNYTPGLLQTMNLVEPLARPDELDRQLQTCTKVGVLSHRGEPLVVAAAQEDGRVVFVSAFVAKAAKKHVIKLIKILNSALSYYLVKRNKEYAVTMSGNPRWLKLLGFEECENFYYREVI